MSTEMNKIEQAYTEALDSITGFEDIAIEKAFGAEVNDLQAKGKHTTAFRAVAFALIRRQGKSDAEAKEAVLGMSFKQLSEFFDPEPDEVVPDEPVTEAGKES